MSDATLYNSSWLDWSALQSQAARAVRQTPLKPAPAMGYVNRASGEYVQLVGPHWVLDHRMENSEGTYSGHIEEEHLDAVYVLLLDGSLVCVRVVDEVWTFPSGGSPVYKDHHTVQNMTETDVQAFDFEKAHYSFNGVWGDAISGGRGQGRLIHGTKGAGLSHLLQDVGEGRTTKLVPATSLAKFYDRAAQQPRLQAAQQRRLASEAASKKLAQASADWNKREARKAKMRRNDRIFDRVIGAFKGGAIGLVAWGILALTMGLNIGFGLLITVLAIAGGAKWLWRP